MTMDLAPEPTLSARGISSISSSNATSTIKYFTDSHQMQYHLLSSSNSSSSSTSGTSSLLGYHLPPPSLAPSVANNNAHTDLLLSVPSSRSLFTPEQWVELTQQTYVYKHLAAGVSPPIGLLIPIISSVPALSRLATSSNALGGTAGGFHSGLLLRGALDPEPGRCRRTDGKKWRCAREAVLDHKYCEKHLHRGRHRARGKTAATEATALQQQQPSVGSLSGGTSNKCTTDNGSAANSTVSKLTRCHTAAPLSADDASVQSSLGNSPTICRETSQLHFPLQSPPNADGKGTFRFVDDNDGLSRLFQGPASRQLHATSVASSGGDKSNHASRKSDNFFGLRSTGAPVPKWLNVATNRGDDDLAAIAKSSSDRTSGTTAGPNYRAPFPFNNLEPDNLAAAASKPQQAEQAVDGWPLRARDCTLAWGPGQNFGGSRPPPTYQLLLPSDLSISTLTACTPSPLTIPAARKDNGDEVEEAEEKDDGMSLSMAVGAAMRSEESALPPSWVPIAWDSPIAGGPLAEVLQPPAHHHHHDAPLNLTEESWKCNAAAINVNKRCKFGQINSPSSSLTSPTDVLNVASSLGSISECNSSSCASSPRSSSAKAL